MRSPSPPKNKLPSLQPWSPTFDSPTTAETRAHCARRPLPVVGVAIPSTGCQVHPVQRIGPHSRQQGTAGQAAQSVHEVNSTIAQQLHSASTLQIPREMRSTRTKGSSRKSSVHCCRPPAPSPTRDGDRATAMGDKGSKGRTEPWRCTQRGHGPWRCHWSGTQCGRMSLCVPHVRELQSDGPGSDFRHHRQLEPQ